MEAHIKINTIKDRLNFVLHAGANLALLAGVVAADKSVVNFSLAFVGVAAPYFIEPLIARGGEIKSFFTGQPATRRRLFPKRIKDADLLPLSSSQAIMSGDVARLQRAADSMCKKLGIEPIEVRVIGSLDDKKDDASEAKKQKRSPKTFAEAREMAKERVAADKLKIFNEKQAVIAINRISGKRVIGISRKLLSELTHDEQEFVIGHELGHVAARHANFKEIANFTGNVGILLAFFHAADLVTNAGMAGISAASPVVSQAWLFRRIVQSHYSRACEIQADRVGAAVTTPHASISALAKLHDEPVDMEKKDTFIEKIIYALHSHPSLPKRLQKLRKTFGLQK